MSGSDSWRTVASLGAILYRHHHLTSRPSISPTNHTTRILTLDCYFSLPPHISQASGHMRHGEHVRNALMPNLPPRQPSSKGLPGVLRSLTDRRKQPCIVARIHWIVARPFACPSTLLTANGHFLQIHAYSYHEDPVSRAKRYAIGSSPKTCEGRDAACRCIVLSDPEK